MGKRQVRRQLPRPFCRLGGAAMTAAGLACWAFGAENRAAGFLPVSRHTDAFTCLDVWRMMHPRKKAIARN